MSYDQTTGINEEPLKTNLSINSDPKNMTFPEISFDCPRCLKPSKASFYGPCEACRLELCAKHVVEVKDVNVKKFEPKMNVTPNAVATKE
ncbi:MAG: hypothetical protein P8O86_02660 [Actinomycetota bacterium]|nr:hypothetical protein [Actinomycetota bacterium]MDG2120286.1 hypothetical protein [Actinomycetota bacterium]